MLTGTDFYMIFYYRFEIEKRNSGRYIYSHTRRYFSYSRRD